MSFLVDACYLCAAVAYLPILLYQMVVQRKNRRGWRQRFGAVDPRIGDEACIWVHAVSLGEMNATARLIERLRRQVPDVQVVVSSTTDTGYARANQLYPDLQTFRFPLDFSWVVRRVLKRIRPDLLILMELEVWYNLIERASRAGIRICVVNGRFSTRSARRFGWVAPWARRMFSRLAWVGAQTEDIAERFRQFGVAPERVHVVGSMKWDTAEAADRLAGQGALASALGIHTGKPLVVLGSSGPGEEALVIDAWQTLKGSFPGTQLAVVPRKPERFDEVARSIEQSGHQCIRRSCHPNGAKAVVADGSPVYLVDTMGELRKVYALADIVIVGRSLVPMGGSDPMEVAALGKPAVVGPHTENFREPVRLLHAAKALDIARSQEHLTQLLQLLLADPQRRLEMGRRALELVASQKGATEKTVAAVHSLLEYGENCQPNNRLR